MLLLTLIFPLLTQSAVPLAVLAQLGTFGSQYASTYADALRIHDIIIPFSQIETFTQKFQKVSTMFATPAPANVGSPAPHILWSAKENKFFAEALAELQKVVDLTEASTIAAPPSQALVHDALCEVQVAYVQHAANLKVRDSAMVGKDSIDLSADEYVRYLKSVKRNAAAKEHWPSVRDKIKSNLVLAQQAITAELEAYNKAHPQDLANCSVGRRLFRRVVTRSVATMFRWMYTWMNRNTRGMRRSLANYANSWYTSTPKATTSHEPTSTAQVSSSSDAPVEASDVSTKSEESFTTAREDSHDELDDDESTTESQESDDAYDDRGYGYYYCANEIDDNNSDDSDEFYIGLV